MKLTPMMQQYLEIKEAHKDCLLFFRLGDFYEMFFEDAVTASRELEITLTARHSNTENPVPMCGVPFHSADNYMARLVEKGYKVAICEQMEDPKNVKGIVKRGVVRIITPGTILEGNNLQEGKNNYIAAIVGNEETFALSICDISTGEWNLTEFTSAKGSKKLLDELAKFSPVECMLNDICYQNEMITNFLKNHLSCLIEEIPAHHLDSEIAIKLLLSHFNLLTTEGIGITPDSNSCLAAASLLQYLKDTQKNDLSHLNKINIYSIDEYMLLDASTRRNLELTETLREKKRKGSLLWVLDHTKTAMGARFLRKCIEQPLINASQINKRLEATGELVENLLLKEELIEKLDEIYDIERLVGKIAYGTCNAKELIALKQSLKVLPYIKELLKDATTMPLVEMYEDIDTLEDIYNLIDQAIVEEPPISLREGGLIKALFNEEVDRLNEVKSKGTLWLRDIETKEKEKTGIKNLKIKYNKVFGYFLEVTNSYSSLVPDYFIRKQTLSNCERYITEELKEIEEEVLGAGDKLTELEYKLFTEIRSTIANDIDRLLGVSSMLAKLDMFCSLADVAYKNNYVRPLIDTSDGLEIKEGRHPVVEKIMGGHQFIANDVYLDNKNEQINLITGPNMAGKSTFMRQVALITLMAQIGSFVPADSAKIGVVDRIFTRVGASDDLASGQSTFMVEMMEVSNILNNATNKSLLILDEIGRGTSTIDGLSIAWAIAEHIADTKLLGAKTLFATHYHELTTLEEKLPNLKNYCVAVKENGEDIIFLHKIVEGSVDHSYGVQVAKLAGLPEKVLLNAKHIMATLEKENDQDIGSLLTCSGAPEIGAKKQVDTTQVIAKESSHEKEQLSLFTDSRDDVIKALKEIDVMHLTPFKAMETLYELQKKVNQ